MIGKIIGAVAGAKASDHFKNVGGATGAVLGAVAVPVIARMRWPTLVVLGAGGYLAKKAFDKEQRSQAGSGNAADSTTGTSAA